MSAVLASRDARHTGGSRLPSLELLASIPDALPTLVFVAAADGSFEHVSERFVEYTGAAIDDALGHRYRRFVHPDDLARAEPEMTTAMLRGAPLGFDVRLRDRRGAYRWHDIRVAPVRRDGAIVRWLGTGTDVDERRRAERTLEIVGQMARAMSVDRDTDGDPLPRFAAAVVTQLADLCAADLLDGPELRRIAVALASSMGTVPSSLVRASPGTATEALAPRAQALTADDVLATASRPPRTPLSTILGWARLREIDARDPSRLERGLAVIERSVSSQGRTLEALGEVSYAVPSNPSGPDTAKVGDESTGPVATAELVGVRVLVVDDSGDGLDLVATVLGLHGARVSSASSAAEALRLLDDEAVEILVSDIGMAEEDGCSLARSALAAHPELRAMALSAYPRPDEQRRALAAGFTYYLTKPFDPARLVATIHALARTAR